MDKSIKQIAFVLMIVALGYAIFSVDFNMKQGTDQLKYSEFMKQVNDGKVKSVLIYNNKKIEGVYEKGDKRVQFETVIPYEDPEIVKNLTAKNIEIKGENPDEGRFMNMIMSILPWLIFFGLIWFLMMRQVQGAGSKAMSFGKSRAKLHAEMKNKVTFADVAGADEAKTEMAEIIDFLKDPKKFSSIGAKIPKGVLLMGPPGTGKTLLARAVAGEAGVPFFSISGSDFVEMFVGVGASRVRDLFDQGKKNAPCIVFIDEIDAVGRLRGAGLGGGHDEREQTLNQLLVEMDGFESNEGVIIIAATNRPDVLDPALLRPGRFDRQIVVDSPDIKGREKILAVHSKKIPLGKEVDLKVIARGTPGFTGADLANLVNEAALLAARRNKKRVTMLEMEEAKDKVLMGPERRSLLLSDKEKEMTAYHEAGHALIGHLTGGDPIHKVTIIPRGRALGLTMSLPEKDRRSYSKSYLLNQVKKAFGGYIAELHKYGEVTTGSSQDIEQATDIARRMVCDWGMSDKLGLLKFGKQNEQIFLGREISQHRDFSEATAQMIDEEITRIVRESRASAEELLKTNVDKFEKMAQYLIERETLNAEEVVKIMNGEALPPLQNGEMKPETEGQDSAKGEEQKEETPRDEEPTQQG
jgi:cell division protease FtsH